MADDKPMGEPMDSITTHEISAEIAAQTAAALRDGQESRWHVAEDRPAGVLCGADFTVHRADLRLGMEAFSDRYVKPIAAVLAFAIRKAGIAGGYTATVSQAHQGCARSAVFSVDVQAGTI